MALNENLSWVEVGGISTGENKFVRDAFKGGMAEKVLLPSGFELYKFNEFRTLTAPNSNAVSPWWSPVKDYKHDGGWEQRKKLAAVLGVSIREFGRVTSAVKENWNSMAYLLTVVLAQETFAYFGGFAQMARLDEKSTSKRITTSTEAGFKAEGRGAGKNLPGGGTQFYIPNLLSSHVSSWRVEPLLDY